MSAPADPDVAPKARGTTKRLLTDLVGAVARHEMLAYFQPQVDIASREIVAAEALCRWGHPDLGLILPTDFIALAEGTQIIDEIGQLMLEAGCRLVASLEKRGVAMDVSVNVSAVQLAHPGFADSLLAQVTTSGIDPTRLTIEITESAQVADVEAARALLQGLVDRGIGVSIDDFGTGYSSVAQVLRLPATELKIDRSVVQGSQAGLIVATEFARSRGLRVVAEGVETPEQLSRVLDAGCERAQGYLFGRAESGRAFEARVLSVS